MSIMTPKYPIGTIIQHNKDESMQRIILYIFTSFYDETGLSAEIYYQTNILENTIPPSPLKESAIDMYYTICTHSKIQVRQ
jgi:hypothetical protein